MALEGHRLSMLLGELGTQPQPPTPDPVWTYDLANARVNESMSPGAPLVGGTFPSYHGLVFVDPPAAPLPAGTLLTSIPGAGSLLALTAAATGLPQTCFPPGIYEVCIQARLATLSSSALFYLWRSCGPPVDPGLVPPNGHVEPVRFWFGNRGAAATNMEWETYTRLTMLGLWRLVLSIEGAQAADTDTAVFAIDIEQAVNFDR